jgi:transcriptional regulator GlxA family with amidase domain
MRIHVLVLEGAFDTGLSAVLDTFATARDLAPSLARKGLRLEVKLIGLRARVRTSQGFTVPTQRAHPSMKADVVLVPAIGAKDPQSLGVALERPDIRAAGVLLREWSRAGSTLCAACTGTFVLAAAGLLDGRAATTSWWLAPFFRERFPKVRLDESQILVKSRGIVTAGAALAHIDLALSLVRRVSPELAAITARYLMLDARSSQAAFAIPDHLARADPMVERFEAWVREHLDDRFLLGTAAQAIGASERTLARRLRSVLGKSPISYVQDLRVERAGQLLRTSRHSVDHVASLVGYANGATLRRLLRRKLGRGVRELRIPATAGA